MVEEGPARGCQKHLLTRSLEELGSQLLLGLADLQARRGVDHQVINPSVYASAGNGMAIHLVGEMFVDEAKVVIRHISYKSTGVMVTDLIGGQVEMGVVALPTVQAYLNSGALRAIACAAELASPRRRIFRRLPSRATLFIRARPRRRHNICAVKWRATRRWRKKPALRSID